MGDPGDSTLAAYEAAADEYVRASPVPGPAVRAYLDRIADLWLMVVARTDHRPMDTLNVRA